MISVILSILKLILIILAFIFLLFIVLLLLVLFVPIRYKVIVESNDSIRAHGRISWLLKILSFHISYIGEDIKFKFMIFGIAIFRSDKEKPEKPKKKKIRTTDTKKKTTKEKDFTKSEAIPKKTKTITKKEQVKKSPIKDKLLKILNKIKSFLGFLKSGILKIYNFLLGIELDEKKQKNKTIIIISFLKDNKLGIKKIIASLKKLLKHIKPKKFNGSIEFGTGDPSQTGQILGVASIFYTKYGRNVKIIPIFDKKVLSGNVFLKGRIRLLTVAIIVLGLIVNEDFKSLLNNFNDLKEEL